MEQTLTLLRRGARALLHAPGFSVLTVITLAVGIGAATAAFTALDAAVLEPLPYANSARLVVLAETRRGREISVSYPDFLDWRTAARSFETLAAFRGVQVTASETGVPERLPAQVVSADLFRALGAQPQLGRLFTADEDRRGAARTVILGHAIWQRLFAADAQIIGRTIRLDGQPWEVVGVMPRDFVFPAGLVYAAGELYFPLGAQWVPDLDNRDSHPGIAVLGLMAPHVRIAEARREMERIAADLARQHPGSNAEIGVLVQDAISVMVGQLRQQLATLTGAAGLLLLIACANVSGMALTRALSRRRELLVRAALGETRRALAGALVAEHLLLAAAGSAAGVGVAFVLTWGIRPLISDLPRLRGLSPDLTALALAALSTLVLALVLGLLPMLWLRRLSLTPSLNQRGQASEGVGTRQALVSGQLALAIGLLAVALLCTASFRKLAAESGGIDARGTLTFQLQLPEDEYPQARRLQFYASLEQRLAAIPGVTAVGAISTLPFSGSGAQSGIRPAGTDVSAQFSADVAVVSRGYFEAMGVPVLRGRGFGAGDVTGAPAVAVVDERLAQRLWPGQDPIGKHLQGWGFPDLEVVGVVRHVKNYGAGAPSREELFVPLTQRASARLHHVVRTSGDPASLAPFVREIVAELDPARPLFQVRTMREVVDRTIATPRLAAVLSTGFGACAVLLATVGLYSLVAYSVQLRRRETGIRMALGATPGAIVRLTLQSVARGASFGVVGGVLVAIGAGSWLQSELFAVSGTDPRLIGTAAAVLTVSAMMAGWLPARQAAKTPPAIVLRND